jgi:methionine sulfoxide reductase heme-binding subunit
MSDQVFWFATRGAGVMAWFGANVAVIAGLLMSSRALGRRPSLPWLTDLHRYFGAMAMIFLALHMLTLWADAFISFSWRELFLPGVAQVPGSSRLALALGVVAAWVMALVEVSSLLKRRLPVRFWHIIHLGSYAVVVMGTVHAWQVGSDASNRVLIATGASVLAAIVLLGTVRIMRKLSDRKFRYDALQAQATLGPQSPQTRRSTASQ